MQKSKAKWVAFFTATLLLLSFALGACGVEDKGLGDLRSIHIVTNGLQTTYTVGDEFDYSAVRINAVYENGDESLTAADTDKGVSHNELDMTTAGTQTLTVTYKQKEASVNITVIEKKTSLQSLQFAGGKTAYQVGDAINFADFKLKAQFSTGADVDLTGVSEGVTHDPATISTAEPTSVNLKFTYTKDGESASTVVPVTVTAAPPEVTLTSIEVQSEAADRSVAFNGTLDYSKFTIVQHLSDGTSDSTLKGNSQGVTHTEIDTTRPGPQELTFTYQGKSATIVITVLAQKLQLTRFALPDFYANVMSITDDENGTESTDRDTFMKGFETYKVGDDNAFEFQPKATILVSATQHQSVTAVTTFELAIKGSDGNFTAVPAEQLENYVTTDELHPNFYWFQPNAVGHVFKLTVKPDPAAYTFSGESKIEATIEVVDGYNVYDQIGLSVFDNLSPKHWATIKGEAGILRWDDKPLTDYNIVKKGDEKYNPVSNVVLHNNITIDPDQLPDSYFWKTTDTQYGNVESELKRNTEIPAEVSDHLNGSLKDGLDVNSWYKLDDSSSGDLTEEVETSVNMQKGLYTSTGTGVLGNFHTLSYVQPNTVGYKHNLYTVYDGKEQAGSFGTAFPLSHWSIFKYGEYNKCVDGGMQILNEGKPTISDLRILGQSPRKASTDGEPSHLMAFNTCTKEVNLENSIVTRLFCVAVGDESNTQANIKVSDSKMFDIYSNMFYLWRACIDVKTSIMEDAGGPVFIMNDGERHTDTVAPHGVITVDKVSRLKSEAAGEESWYKLNDATPIFTKLKGEVLNYIHTGTGREIMRKGEGGVELFNVIAVIIPTPAKLQSSPAQIEIFPQGEIKRGEEGNYTDEYAVDWKFAPGGILSFVGQSPDAIYNSMAPIFISGTEKAAFVGLSLAQYLYATSSTETDKDISAASSASISFAERGTDWMFATLRAGATAPRFGILFGGVTEYTAS